MQKNRGNMKNIGAITWRPVHMGQQSQSPNFFSKCGVVIIFLLSTVQGMCQSYPASDPRSAPIPTGADLQKLSNLKLATEAVAGIGFQAGFLQALCMSIEHPDASPVNVFVVSDAQLRNQNAVGGWTSTAGSRIHLSRESLCELLPGVPTSPTGMSRRDWFTILTMVHEYEHCTDQRNAWCNPMFAQSLAYIFWEARSEADARVVELLHAFDWIGPLASTVGYDVSKTSLIEHARQRIEQIQAYLAIAKAKREQAAAAGNYSALDLSLMQSHIQSMESDLLHLNEKIGTLCQ